MQRLVLGTDRKVPALWNIASQAGFSVAVVNWWTTYPPEKINGVMISDHTHPGPVGDLQRLLRVDVEHRGRATYPEIWHQRALQLVKLDDSLTPFADPFRGNQGLPSFLDPEGLSRIFRTDSWVVRTALAVEADLAPDLLMVYMAGVDRVSHSLWGSLEPIEAYSDELRPTPEQHEAGAKALLEYYDYTDALLGLLVDRFGRDDLVMVVSDHGMVRGPADSTQTGSHALPAARYGVILARGAAVRSLGDHEEMTVLDVTPSILAWLGLPVAADMEGRVLPFLDVNPPEPVDTYDGIPVERLSGGPSGAEGVILEQLRSLGYIE